MHFLSFARWDSKIKTPAVLVYGETSLLGLQMAAFSLASCGLFSVNTYPCCLFLFLKEHWIRAPTNSII